MNSTDWFYKGILIDSIEKIPNYESVYGFVYLIENTANGKFYIGRKILRTTRKKKISQRAKKATGTRKIYEQKVTESDWKEYYGSSKELQADIQKYGKQNFRRTMIEFCCSKKYLSYAELAWQVKLDVLKENSYNGNILGRYYSRDMENCT